MSSETYKYKSTVVAKYIISRANEANIAMNMTKLQKLLYITYGIYLIVKGERLINEQPKAWPFGPVFPTTRQKLLHLDFIDYDILKDGECTQIQEDKEHQYLVDLVFSSFGKLSAGQLSEWSHQKGSPWHQTTQLKGFKWNQNIPDEYIKDYFGMHIVKK
jgi:uncharacterized phage-associated protein